LGKNTIKNLKEVIISIKMLKIYFAHPIIFYNTELEKDLIEKIKSSFSYYEIENPDQEHHQRNYKLWKEKTGSGMKYYFEEVLPKMSSGIGLPFEDGMYGFGVFGELQFISEKKCPIWEINHKGIITLIQHLDYFDSKVLSLEETRKRIYL
jgi:hypothetical protein